MKRELTGTHAVLRACACIVVCAFLVLCAFEVRIAAIAAQAAEVTEQLRRADELAVLPIEVERARRTIDTRIAELRLGSKPGTQAMALFSELERLAALRRLRLIALRSSPGGMPQAGKRRSELDERAYEAIFEGAYRNALLALTDLARIPLVLRPDRLAFERLQRQGRYTGEVRATYSLQIERISKKETVLNASALAP